jgi:hypothetical protein
MGLSLAIERHNMSGMHYDQYDRPEVFWYYDLVP